MCDLIYIVNTFKKINKDKLLRNQIIQLACYVVVVVCFLVLLGASDVPAQSTRFSSGQLCSQLDYNYTPSIGRC